MCLIVTAFMPCLALLAMTAKITQIKHPCLEISLEPELTMKSKSPVLSQAPKVGVSVPQLAKTKEHQASTPEPSMFTTPGVYPNGWRLGIVIVSFLFGTLLVAIDNTIVGTVVPKISTVFNALDEVGWYGSSDLLTATALQPTFGTIYNYFNVKLTYLISILIFEGEIRKTIHL